MISVFVYSPHGVITAALALLVQREGFAVSTAPDADVALRDLCNAVDYPPPFDCPTLALIADGDASELRILQLGYRGYLRPTDDPADVAVALRKLGDGGSHAHPSAIVASFGCSDRAVLTSLETASQELTAREREALNLLLLGLSNVEMARRMGVTTKTVKGYNTEIYTKLGARGRRELVLRYGSGQSDGPL